MSMTLFWLFAITVFVIFEAVSFGLTSIWFAVGAVAGMIGSVAGASITVQVILFLIVSTLTLLFTRPLVKKFVAPKITRTNADRIFDKTGVVIEMIDNIAGTGTVSVDGKLWTARSEKSDVIQPNEMVKIIRISGVKVFVEKTEKSAEADSAGAVQIK